MSDSNPASVPTFFVAVHRVYYTVAADAGPPLGFNLDGVCTCEDAGPSSCNSGSFQHCDGPDGRDVTGNALLSLFDGFYSSGSVAGSLNGQIAAGLATILIGIANYNGGPDDTEVALTAFISSGIRGDGGYLPPVWDGNDAWDVDPISTAGYVPVDGGYAYTPLFVSTQGYVNHGVLVAYVPDVALDLGFGTLDLGTVVFASTIQPAPGGYRLVNGQLAGRVSTHSVLSLAAELPDPLDSTMSLCGTDPTYLTVRQAVCQSADIVSTPALDNTGAVCNAISLSLGFGADPVKLGAPLAVAHHPLGCDGAVDDCTAVDGGGADTAQ